MTRGAAVPNPDERSFRSLDEQDTDRLALTSERQTGFLMEVLQHQRLVVILSAHLLGERASRVVEPTEVILRRRPDLAHDRPLDPLPGPLQKLRIRAGASSRAATAG